MNEKAIAKLEELFGSTTTAVSPAEAPPSPGTSSALSEKAQGALLQFFPSDGAPDGDSIGDGLPVPETAPSSGPGDVQGVQSERSLATDVADAITRTASGFGSGFAGSTSAFLGGMEFLQGLGGDAEAGGILGVPSPGREAREAVGASSPGDNPGTSLWQLGADAAGDVARRLAAEDPTLYDKVVQGLGSWAAFALPGAAVGRGVSALGAVAPRIAQIAGSVSGGVMEGFSEAGNVYRDLLSEGASADEASAAAGKTLLLNIPLDVLTDYLGFFGESKPLATWLAKGLSAAGGGAKTPALARVLAQAAAGAVSEPVQEVGQQLISDKYSEGASWEDALSRDRIAEAAGEAGPASAIVGALGGGLFGAAGVPEGGRSLARAGRRKDRPLCPRSRATRTLSGGQAGRREGIPPRKRPSQSPGPQTNRCFSLGRLHLLRPNPLSRGQKGKSRPAPRGRMSRQPFPEGRSRWGRRPRRRSAAGHGRID